MKTPPESFLLFKEELKKVQLEKERLSKQYEERIAELNAELCRLKEQIGSQQDMLRTTLDYASQLESNLDKFKEEVSESEEQRRNGVY